RLDVSLKVAEFGEGFVEEVALAAVDQPIKRRPAKVIAADRLGQRGRYFVPPGRAAVIRGLDDLAPPLQADLPEHRLAHALAHPRDFVIESVERKEALAPIGACEQRR